MDRFIAEQEAEGAADSSGAFTISADLAREKLQTFQWADQTFYLLKVVQAAVRAGAQALRVTAGRAQLSVRFECPDMEAYEPRTVAKALMEAHSLVDSAIRHLAVGLNAASTQEFEEIRWSTPSGSLVLSRESIRYEDALSDGLELTLRKKRTLLDWFRGTVFAAELVTLGKRCCYVPLDLTLDGRAMDRPGLDRFGQHQADDLGLTHEFYLLERQKPGSKLWLQQPPSECYHRGGVRWVWTADKKPRQPVPLLLEGAEGTGLSPVDMVVALNLCWTAAGTVLYVKDGVTLKPLESVDLGHPGAVVVADAEGLTLDLSEFAVVEGESLQFDLAELREFVRDSTENLGGIELETALSNGGLEKERLAAVFPLLQSWLQNHLRPQPISVPELVIQCFPHRPPMYTAPDIPASKERSVRKVHGELLPPEEQVLAVYDDSFFGGAKTGFVITGNRLCWRDSFDYSHTLLWESVRTDQLHREGNKVVLMGAEIPAIMRPQMAEKLIEFLRGVKELGLRPTLEWGPGQASIIDIALANLGMRAYVHYHPHIPKKKLEAVRRNFRDMLDPEERPLLFYDDTLFGSGDVGTVITTEKLLWKNTLSEAKFLPWPEVTSGFLVAGTGVQFGENELSVCRENTRQALADFLNKVARARGGGLRV